MPRIYLPNISNTRHLRKLILGMNSSYFLERLLTCIPLIENLSIGVKDPSIKDKNYLNIRSSPINARFLLYLSTLSINCANNHSFHRSMTILSSILNQLSHLSLKLHEYTCISDPLIISSDIIHQVCLSRLNASATYDLNLLFRIMCDVEEKRILNSFINNLFVYRQQSKIFIQETNHDDIDSNCHSFIVYTILYNDKKFSSHLLCRNSQIFSQTTMNSSKLFRHFQEFHLDEFMYNSCFSDLTDCTSLASSMIPWSLLTKISICGTDFIKSSLLEAILKTAFNVRTLEISDDTGRLPCMILRNKNNLGNRINEQIQSLNIWDCTITLLNAERFCIRLYNQLPNLKNLTFHIFNSYYFQEWKPLCVVDGKNKSTIMIVNIIHFIVDKFQELVSFYIYFMRQAQYHSPCFPHLIRKQLHEQPLSRPYRLRCTDEAIQIWI
ncbi:unnamed protein product [Adineta steineri]|uniref:Uncharacterized protein n=1 Tax=Adineta steineri TaxID=433720 RepID=A0A818HBH2_9BILA|nr:unnamed protein product [Adineta steineri]